MAVGKMLLLLLITVGLGLLRCAAAARVCARPREIPSALFQPGKVLYESGNVVTYSCMSGYEKESGNERATCLITGNWEHATLRCKAIQCPKPGPLDNGRIRQRDLTYGSIISFSCNVGFRLYGASESECLEAGKWSAPLPKCELVTCPPPPVPKFGQLELYQPGPKNLSAYSDVVTYQCLQNYALIGNENATCTENGTWTKIPECWDVKCLRPTVIAHGYMSFAPYRQYNYRESVTYGCNPPYALDGPRTSFCDKDGDWTPKPACRAPCHVTTPKATVLHNGRRTRVDKISDQQIQHGDIMTYFCKNKEEKCAYTVPSQCRDGNFTVPACYKKPGLLSVFSTDPANMAPCSQELQP